MNMCTVNLPWLPSGLRRYLVFKELCTKIIIKDYEKKHLYYLSKKVLVKLLV